MSVSVITENGSGLTNATTYLSVAEFRNYAAQNGVTSTYSSIADSTIGTWVNDATEYIDLNYCFGGTTYTTTQALEVPRSNWYDRNGNDIEGTVPDQLKKAVYKLSTERQGSSPSADTTSVTGISSKTVGPVSISYTDGGATTTTYPGVKKQLIGLLKKSSGNLCLPK